MSILSNIFFHTFVKVCQRSNDTYVKDFKNGQNINQRACPFNWHGKDRKNIHKFSFTKTCAKKKVFLGERNSYTTKLGRTDLTSNITFEKTEYMSHIRYTHQDSSFSYYNHLLFHFREKCGFVEPIYTSRILSNN